MIKNFLRKVGLMMPAAKAEAALKEVKNKRVITAQEHRLNAKSISPNARQVVDTLQKAGFEAYIVGGAVRDLLLDLRPKDFDVATNATPEQVKKCFKRAFIIGRRFRLVHVVFGQGRQDLGFSEIIEVSTFRAHVAVAPNKSGTPEQANAHKFADQASRASKTNASTRGFFSRLRSNPKHAVDASGRVLRDNIFGSLEEDARRRDFTINALYLNPITMEILDFHGGVADTQKRVLRIIGDPVVRYREDPVRMVRAIRFLAKLADIGFDLEPSARAAIAPNRALLVAVPAARKFDEFLKLLQTGNALKSLKKLKELELAPYLDPIAVLMVERMDDPFIEATLKNTDARIERGAPSSPSFLLACVLWRDVLIARNEFQKRPPESLSGSSAQDLLHAAMEHVFAQRIGDVSGRGKLGTDMRDIWRMQPRFERTSVKAAINLLGHPRIRAGMDFLELRVQSMPAGTAQSERQILAQWWRKLVDAHPDERARLLETSPPPAGSDSSSAHFDADTDSDSADLAQKGQTTGASRMPRARRTPAVPVTGASGAAVRADSGSAAKGALKNVDGDEDDEDAGENPAPKRPRRRRRGGRNRANPNASQEDGANKT